MDVRCGSFEGREKSHLLCGEECNLAQREVLAFGLGLRRGSPSPRDVVAGRRVFVCLKILSYHNSVIWGGGFGSLGLSGPVEVNHMGGPPRSSEGAPIKPLDSKV